MGGCLSRRKYGSSSEREPLLPQNRPGARSNLDPNGDIARRRLEKAMDIVAALRAGKFPSQSQLNIIFEHLLRSDVLSQSNAREGEISKQGQAVIDSVRTFLQVSIQVGLDKNYDDVLQNFVYNCQRVQAGAVEADIAVNANQSGQNTLETIAQDIPPQAQVAEDTQQLVASIFLLCRLIATSSAFRIVLSDLFSSFRDFVAEIATDIAAAASQVADTASAVQAIVQSDNEIPSGLMEQDLRDVSEQAFHAGQDAKNQWETLGMDQTKAAVINRVQEALIQADRNPSFHDAISTILTVFRKYANSLAKASHDLSSNAKQAPAMTLVPTLWTNDTNLLETLSTLGSLLSRFSSGFPVGAIVESLYNVTTDVLNAPLTLESPGHDAHNEDGWILRNFFRGLGTWLDKCLNDVSFVTSPEGRRDIEDLYDRARSIFTGPASNLKVVKDIRLLVSQVNSLIDAMKSDELTNRLMDSISEVMATTSEFSSLSWSFLSSELPERSFRQAKELRDQVQKDIVLWFLPRLIRSIKSFPMPRVEFVNNSLEVAVDALLLTSSAGASLLPDHIQFTSFNDIALSFSETTTNSDPTLLSSIASSVLPSTSMTQMRKRTRNRLYIDGMRFSARDIGYYFNYKGPLGSSYEDQGLISVDIGNLEDDQGGISVDIELEMDDQGPTDQHGDPQGLFVIKDVQLTLPHLSFTLYRTKHSILNYLFVQPLTAPLMRTVAKYYLQRQIRGMLESLNSFYTRVAMEAQHVALDGRRGEMERSVIEVLPEDYWTGFLRAIGLSSSKTFDDNGQSGQSEVNEPSMIETYLVPSVKGIVQVSVDHSSSPAAESSIAVGVGSQLLPGKGGPYDEDSDDYGLQDAGREALTEVQEVIEDSSNKANRALQDAQEIQEQGQTVKDVIMGDQLVNRDRCGSPV
ncbi:hypothetical protein ABKN59_007176 [Abortiporus biennis]